jgi:hypothetical protein
MENVNVMMSDWRDYWLVWVCLIAVALIMVLLVMIRLKLSSMSKATKQSFKDLSMKIDNMARTNDAFNELNAKIDHMNRTARDIQRLQLDSESRGDSLC